MPGKYLGVQGPPLEHIWLVRCLLIPLIHIHHLIVYFKDHYFTDPSFIHHLVVYFTDQYFADPSFIHHLIVGCGITPMYCNRFIGGKTITAMDADTHTLRQTFE